MRYVVACFNREIRDTTYRICMSDSLRLVTENTALQVGGKQYTARYIELVTPKKEEKRSADEIIDHIKEGLRRISK